MVLGSLMSEFSPFAQSPDVATAGEMKASSDFYSDEGAASKGPARAWTGDGGAGERERTQERARARTSERTRAHARVRD